MGTVQGQELPDDHFTDATMTLSEWAACRTACKAATKEVIALKTRIETLVSTVQVLIASGAPTSPEAKLARKEALDITLMLHDDNWDEEHPRFAGILWAMKRTEIKKVSAVILEREKLIAQKALRLAEVAAVDRTLLDWKVAPTPVANNTLSQTAQARFLELETDVLALKQGKDSSIALLPGSKSARLLGMKSPALPDNIKAAREATYAAVLSSSFHKEFGGRKLHDSKMLVIDSVDKRSNADAILGWEAMHKLFFGAFVSADQSDQGITKVAWCSQHFGPAAAQWWGELNLPTWHPVKHDAELFFRFVLASLTPNDSDETSFSAFSKIHYKDFVNFEAWTNALKVQIKLNRGAEDRYKLTDNNIWTHIDLGSPKFVRKAFIANQCDQNTEPLLLQQVAKRAEDLEIEVSRRDGTSHYSEIRDSRAPARPPHPSTRDRPPFRRSGGVGRVYSLEEEVGDHDRDRDRQDQPPSSEETWHESLVMHIGHSNSLRPTAELNAVAQGRVSLCYRCYKPGHFSRDCTEVEPPGGFVQPAGSASARRAWQPPRQAARETGFANPQYRPQGGLPRQFNSPKPMGQGRAWFKGRNTLAQISEDEEDVLVDGGAFDKALVMEDAQGSLFVIA